MNARSEPARAYSPAPVEWQAAAGLVDYPDALRAMEDHVAAMLEGRAGEKIWLLEHPPLYTAGTSAKDGDLLQSRFPTYEAGRGGEWTYHGPGQRVAYAMLDLRARDAMDVRRYVANLEQWIIATLAQFGIEGFTREGRIGVWVNLPSPLAGEGWVGGGSTTEHSRTPPHPNPPPQGGREFKEAKIAALGIRVRKWVTFHGICLNVNPDLSHYAGIVPCGISEFGVTSLHALGVKTTLQDVDKILRQTFRQIF